MYIYTYIYTPKVSRYMYLDTLQHWIVLSGLIKNTKGKKILSVTFCGSP